jgi:hypothetical protein
MEKGAAGFPQGPTNPGISRYLASRLPYARPVRMSGVWKRSGVFDLSHRATPRLYARFHFPPCPDRLW